MSTLFWTLLLAGVVLLLLPVLAMVAVLALMYLLVAPTRRARAGASSRPSLWR